MCQNVIYLSSNTYLTEPDILLTKEIHCSSISPSRTYELSEIFRDVMLPIPYTRERYYEKGTQEKEKENRKYAS